MKRIRLVLAALGITSIIAFSLSFRPVQAHEGRDIGPYSVEFGWQVEPAYAGVQNGPILFIEMKDDSSKKVTGAEATLKLTVSFGGKSKEMKFNAADGNPGQYVADLIPTRAGDYTFVLTGKIGDTDVNETFVSGDHFSSVEPAGDLLFPDDNADAVSLQTQIDALKAEVETLKAKVK